MTDTGQAVMARIAAKKASRDTGQDMVGDLNTNSTETDSMNTNSTKENDLNTNSTDVVSINTNGTKESDLNTNSTRGSLNITGSMMGNDRSRSMDTRSSRPDRKASLGWQEPKMKLAGPMQDKDNLHYLNLAVTTTALAFSAAAILLPNWLYVYSAETDKQFMYNVASSGTCTNETHQQAIKDQNLGSTAIICHGSDSSFKIGGSVSIVSMLGYAGAGFILLNIILQLVNMLMKHRSKGLQNATLVTITLAGTLMLIAGLIGHCISVWALPHYEGNIYVRIQSGGAGLLQLTVGLCAWSVVLIHVASHAPGPLSHDTRFAHMYDVQEDHAEPLAPPCQIIMDSEDQEFEEPLTIAVEQPQTSGEGQDDIALQKIASSAV